MEPELTATSGNQRRRLWVWIARATSSLPVPLSPRITTLESVSATVRIISSTCAMAGLTARMGVTSRQLRVTFSLSRTFSSASARVRSALRTRFDRSSGSTGFVT